MNRSERFKQLTCTEAIRGDLQRSSVRAAAFTGAAAAGDFIVRIGSTAVLARLILPEHFGLVMMVMAVTAVADQLRELGLSAATVQQKEITYGQVTNLFWINAIVGVCIAGLVSALSPLIAAYYRDPRLVAITCLLATNFIFGGLMVQHQALLTRQLRLGHTSMVRLCTSVLSTLLAIVLAWMGFGYWALVWREVSRSILLVAGMWLCLPWIPGLPSRRSDIRAMIGFGANLTVANIVGSLSGGADRFFIGRFWGATPVAIYRQAYQLMVAPTDQLLSPIYQVAQPALSLLQGDGPRFRRYYQKVLTLVCLLTMPLSVFVATYSGEITRVFLGPRWMQCAPTLMILSFGTFIKQAAGSTAFVLISRGKSRTYLSLSLFNNAVFVLLMILGVHWGIIGVAMADVVTTWVLVGPRLFLSLKDSPVPVWAFISTIARPAVASIAMAMALIASKLYISGQSTLLALANGGLTAVTAFLLTWIFLPGGRAELRTLIADMRSNGRRKGAVSISEEARAAASEV